MTVSRYFRILSMVARVSLCVVLVNVGKTQSASAGPSTGLQPSPNSPGPKKAEEEFKNIQVLKGIPADQLFPTMQFITASLGVECDFCHVQNAFEKDDKKPKEIARKMMGMMFAINKDNFEGHREVTCYSCHRGNANPVAIPAVITEEPKAGMGGPHQPGGEKAETKEASGPTAQRLIDKYVQASGGAGAIDKVTSRVMKGTIDFGGRSLPIDIYSKNPEKRISFTHMSDGDSVTAFNGQEGWLGSPGRPLREMRGSDLDAAAIDADLHLATHLEKMFSKMQVRGVEKIDDKDAYEVLGQREGKTPIRLYFDQQSGLLLRLVRFGDTALGWLPTEIDYADYREVNGVKVPYRWTLARPSGKFTIQVSELNQNVPVDDGKFDRPASPPEASKATTR
jgi:photosynthetic reaction center cytochrome c subunit